MGCGTDVALKDRLNGLKNPHSHLAFPDISYEMVAESPMLWDPIRFLETCPSSDGACAVVLGGLAYAGIAAMTATSFDRTAAWLGPRRWRRLHVVAGHYVWFIFLASYLPRAIIE